MCLGLSFVDGAKIGIEGGNAEKLDREYPRNVARGRGCGWDGGLMRTHLERGRWRDVKR